MSADRPNILFVPPLGLLLALGLTWGLTRLAPLGILPPWPWAIGIVLGGLLILFAVYTNISGARAFLRAGTHINPYKPALIIVRDGAFRYTRNPMYLGMVLVTLGLGLVFSTLWGAVCAALLWAALHFGVVLREEAYLTDKFGDDYRTYLATTRRWL